MSTTPAVRSVLPHRCSRPRRRRTTPGRSAPTMRRFRRRISGRSRTRTGCRWRPRAPTRTRSTGARRRQRSPPSSASGASTTIRWKNWRTTSTGRRSSRPGSYPGVSRPFSTTRWWAKRRARFTTTRARCWIASSRKDGSRRVRPSASGPRTPRATTSCSTATTRAPGR